MYQYISIMALLGLITSCTNPKLNKSTFNFKGPQAVPSWFKKLPEIPQGQYIDVGYARMSNYHNLKSVKYAAVKCAIKNIAKQKNIKIDYTLTEISDGRITLTNPFYHEVLEVSLIDEINANYQVIDSFLTEEAYFILVKYPGNEGYQKPESRLEEWEGEPAWIKNTPVVKNAIYSIGMTARYSNWTTGWNQCDELARIGLGQALYIAIDSEQYEEIRDRLVKTSRISHEKCEIELIDSKITARWFDQVSNRFYALAEINIL